MKHFSVFVLFLISGLWVEGRAVGAELVYYSIVMNDNLVGYALVESERTTDNGKEMLRLKSTTTLRVTLLGKPHNVRLESETLVRPDDGRPIRYTLTNNTNDAVNYTECEIADGVARTWTYRKGEKKATPTETKLPAHTLLLSGNNFAHWGLLARAAAAEKGGKAKLTVFVPEGGAVDTMEMTRGETRDLDVRGKPRPCTRWRLEKADMTVWVDTRSHEFVRLEVPAQQSTVTLLDESVVKEVQKARAEDVLARHFTQSNVVFDDYLKVTSLKAELDVQLIGSGVESDVAGLATAMQVLEGKKDGARLTGTVTVHTKPYDGKDSPAFPGKPDDRFARWLKPEPFIESDDKSITARSAELVQGAATRWEAALRIARWVHKNIRYTIGDTPSARLALEKKAGDCGPHATLTVALLRAAGIPARLVGGLMYAPIFGGSFGQHAWVEVHLGPAGWVTIDPTTGEYEKVGASHIKLFDGMGGVVPKSIKVVAFQPPNQFVHATATRKALPLPWKPDRKYTFTFTQAGKEFGTEVVSIMKVKHGGKDAYRMNSDLSLKAGGRDIKSTTSLTVEPNGMPLAFHRDYDIAGTKYTIECTFREGTAQVKVSGARELTRAIKVPAGVYCFDNNLMGSWVLLLSQLDYAAGKEVSVRAFHPSSLQILPITFKPEAPAEMSIGGKKLACYKCDISSLHSVFWITRDGRFVKTQQGDMVIEL